MSESMEWIRRISKPMGSRNLTPAVKFCALRAPPARSNQPRSSGGTRLACTTTPFRKSAFSPPILSHRNRETGPSTDRTAAAQHAQLTPSRAVSGIGEPTRASVLTPSVFISPHPRGAPVRPWRAPSLPLVCGAKVSMAAALLSANGAPLIAARPVSSTLNMTTIMITTSTTTRGQTPRQIPRADACPV
jgi:hypothetical protein